MTSDTQPAPLLTAEDFFEASDLLSGYAVSGRCHDLAHLLAYYAQALADGRTACVRVMSEAEIRKWFDEWVETAGAHGHRIGAVLAFARAMGAVR